MENYLAQFFTVVLLHLLAVISPGPDFVLISRNSLVYSRKTGIYSSLGLALGISLHVTYSLIGIGYLISQSVVVFSIIKTIGALYLLYIGYKSLKAKPSQLSDSKTEQLTDMSKYAAIKNGFLTNALNPKATLFFLALFTQVIDNSTPIGIKILFGIEMSVMTFIWFSLVAIVLSNSYVKKPFIKIQHYVERTMGAALIFLGFKVLLSKSK